MATTVRLALVGAPSDPVSVRTALFPEGTVLPQQRAPWGKLLFAVHGVAEFWIGGELALSPPAYAIWIPPARNTGHAHRARSAMPESISERTDAQRCRSSFAR